MEDTKRDLAVLCEQLKAMCERQNNLEEIVKDEKRRLNHNPEKITARLDSLNATMGEHWVKTQQMANSKPTWATTTILTILGSAVVGLAVKLLSQ